MREQLDALQGRVAVLERRVVVLTTVLVLLIAYAAFRVGVQAKAAQPQNTLVLKRLTIVDDKGAERVVIAAPLPDPIILGKRVKRDGPVSGILIFDPKGNERGGYVTSDAGDLSAFLTLDSERDQVFTAFANHDSGATLWLANERHDAVALNSHGQPSMEILQNRKVIYKNPPNAPDLH